MRGAAARLSRICFPRPEHQGKPDCNETLPAARRQDRLRLRSRRCGVDARRVPGLSVRHAIDRGLRAPVLSMVDLLPVCPAESRGDALAQDRRRGGLRHGCCVRSRTRVRSPHRRSLAPARALRRHTSAHARRNGQPWPRGLAIHLTSAKSLSRSLSPVRRYRRRGSLPRGHGQSRSRAVRSGQQGHLG